MIQLTKVSFAYGERALLHELNLRLSEHRIGIVGANGSGKSTFARLLNGLLLPTTGVVTVDGLDTKTHAKAVRQKVGFVFSNPDHQIIFPIVAEDIAFGLSHRGLNKEKIQERIDNILGMYDLMHLKERSVHTLSSGEKQLISLAGVLVMAPTYIVFDEPTTFLDLGNRKKVQRAMHALQQSIIVVSHDLDALADFDRIIVFDKGAVIADGPPHESLAFYQERFS